MEDFGEVIEHPIKWYCAYELLCKRCGCGVIHHALRESPDRLYSVYCPKPECHCDGHMSVVEFLNVIGTFAMELPHLLGDGMVRDRE
jgi:hypothetical protein